MALRRGPWRPMDMSISPEHGPAPRTWRLPKIPTTSRWVSGQEVVTTPTSSETTRYSGEWTKIGRGTSRNTGTLFRGWTRRGELEIPYTPACRQASHAWAHRSKWCRGRLREPTYTNTATHP